MLLQHGDDEFVLACEIRIEGAPREAGRGGDGFDACRTYTLFLEYLRGCLEQLFAGVVARRPGANP
jgi:hypothetical protein